MIVLILIILEVTLWEAAEDAKAKGTNRLNPYYTGSYSMRFKTGFSTNYSTKGLNPYYTGSYSMSYYSYSA